MGGWDDAETQELLWPWGNETAPGDRGGGKVAGKQRPTNPTDPEPERKFVPKEKEETERRPAVQCKVRRGGERRDGGIVAAGRYADDEITDAKGGADRTQAKVPFGPEWRQTLPQAGGLSTAETK